MSIWENKETMNEYQICDAPIIQIRPSNERSNLYIFSKDGYVHHVDGFDFKTISSIRLSEHELSCVEEVKTGNTRAFLVADIDGNLILFDSSFKTQVTITTKSSPITAIQCIGKDRTLITYSLKEGTVRMELIKTLNGSSITSLDFSGTRIIKDIHCPSHKYDKNSGWVIAGSDTSIFTVEFKMSLLKQTHIEYLSRGIFLDELICTMIEQNHVGKEIILDDHQIVFEDVHYACDDEEKVSTISLNYEIKTITEWNNLYIKGNFGKINKHVDLGDNRSISKNLHFPEGRVCCGTSTGEIICLDWRINSLKFIMD